MTAPELLDPQQAAFWAADPNILHEPDPLAPAPETEPEQTHRARLALEIAAAFLVCVRIARAHLANQRDADPHKAGTQAWSGVVGTFKALTSDALVRALRIEPHTSALSPRQLTTLADTYVGGLGAYLGESSVTAFVGAVDRQLADRWSQEVAYARAVAGFGLEKQALGPFLAKAAAVVDQEIVTPAAQAISDAALLVRAELIGDTEARTAVDGVKAMHWRQQLANGELPATARRRWATHHLDMDCAVCGALHGQEVELDKPFRVETFEIWAPLAHPNCQCSIELVHTDVAKAYNPNERRGQPGNRGQWAANPVTYADPLEERTEAPAPPVEKPSTPFAKPAAPNPFAGSPFSQSTGGSPFARATGSANPFALAEPSGKLAGPSGKLRSASGRLRASGQLRRFRSQTNRRIAIVPVPPPKIEPQHYPYYLAAAAYHAEVGEHDAGTILPIYSDVDFDKAHPTKYGALHAEAVASPWSTLDWETRSEGRIRVDPDGRPVANLPAVSEWWYDIAPDLYRGHMVALDNGMGRWGEKGLIGQLDGEDRWAISEMAGFHDWTDDTSLTAAIVAAVSDEDDHGLAQAYADYVPLYRPDLLGALGEQINDKMRTGELEYGVSLTDRPVDQVLTFSAGFHPQTRRSRTHADPRGRFVVIESDYRSAFNDMGDRPPPLALGMQEAYMQPMERHNRPPLSRFGQLELE